MVSQRVLKGMVFNRDTERIFQISMGLADVISEHCKAI
jgi:hypothetical protein